MANDEIVRCPNCGIKTCFSRLRSGCPKCKKKYDKDLKEVQ